MTRILAAALIAMVALAVASQALAQQPACDKRADVIRHLANKYSESPVAIGLANNGGVIEVLTDAEGSSWTIIITMPNGRACMIAAGESWESVPQTVKENGT